MVYVGTKSSVELNTVIVLSVNVQNPLDQLPYALEP